MGSVREVIAWLFGVDKVYRVNSEFEPVEVHVQAPTRPTPSVAVEAAAKAAFQPRPLSPPDDEEDYGEGTQVLEDAAAHASFGLMIAREQRATYNTRRTMEKVRNNIRREQEPSVRIAESTTSLAIPDDIVYDARGTPYRV